MLDPTPSGGSKRNRSADAAQPTKGRSVQSLMVDFITSLDGYGAAEGWPGFWGMEGPEYLGWLEEQEEHTALMGATTYRLMSGFAGQTPDEPGMAGLTPQPEGGFSSKPPGPLSWGTPEAAR